jgi:hypothetical protein
MLLAFPRIVRLSYRVVIWNAGHNDDNVDVKLKRTPGATAEFNEIAKFVMPDFSPIGEKDGNNTTTD